MYMPKTDILVCQSIFDTLIHVGFVLKNPTVITPAQCRAARGLLDWSQQGLADRAGVGIVTVRKLEGGTSRSRRATMDVIKRALETGGVEFIEENGGGSGVRLRKVRPKRRDR